jgi:hypothetical protein
VRVRVRARRLRLRVVSARRVSEVKKGKFKRKIKKDKGKV